MYIQEFRILFNIRNNKRSVDKIQMIGDKFIFSLINVIEPKFLSFCPTKDPEGTYIYNTIKDDCLILKKSKRCEDFRFCFNNI